MAGVTLGARAGDRGESTKTRDAPMEASHGGLGLAEASSDPPASVIIDLGSSVSLEDLAEMVQVGLVQRAYRTSLTKRSAVQEHDCADPIEGEGLFAVDEIKYCDPPPTFSRLAISRNIPCRSSPT